MDSDVEEVRTVVIDIDPIRSNGGTKHDATTDSELQVAIRVAEEIGDYLETTYLAHPAIAMSGNGAQVWVPIKPVPVGNEWKTVSGRFQAFQHEIIERWGNEELGIAVDNIGNLSRIIKVIGTQSIKGVPSIDRPWRRSKWLRLPEKVNECEKLTSHILSLEPRETASATTNTRGPPLRWTPEAIHKLISGSQYATALFAGGDEDRSKADWKLSCWLLKKAVPPKQVAELLSQTPWTKGKERGEGYITLTINRALKKVRDDILAPFEVPDEQESEGADHDPPILEVTPDMVRITPSRHLTELGNARRLVDRYGPDIRFAPDVKKWYLWDDIHWKRDKTGEIQRKAKDIMEQMRDDAATIEDDELQKKYLHHISRSETSTKIEAMIKLAGTEPEIPILTEALDTDPLLLTCKNGTIDLKTGILRPSKRSDYITMTSPCVYDPDAECPQFDAFLYRIMDGNENLIEFLWEAIGYSLTGLTIEQVFFILWGGGSNGKSTFIEIIKAMLGDYAQTAPTEALMEKKGESISNDIAKLKGARFVSAVESGSGKKLHEVLIKQMTGGDAMSARFLFAEFFEFYPTFKLWLATNFKPKIFGVDHAIWRRIRLIPFTVTIPPEEQDKNLGSKLKEELPGIFAKAVRYAKRWTEQGLSLPEEVNAATLEYREEMDPLKIFLESVCVIADAQEVRASVLYNGYESWADQEKEKPLTKRTFGTHLKARGFTQKRGSKGVRHWVGIRLMSSDDQMELTIEPKEASSISDFDTEEVTQ